MCEKLDKIYDPCKFEDEIYKFWEDNGCFDADFDSKKEAYTIAMPPPNITGNLHMGHALDNTIQDVLIRYNRMCGKEVFWIPGTDHAAMATEARIVAKLRSEGLTKEKIGREKFMERAFAWKKEYGGNIVRQIRKLGASCDWKRERFTMDDGYYRSVRDFFCTLYKEGLIYKGNRIVNWCINCKTSISDIEVDFKESNGELIHLKYYFPDRSAFLTVATTRPETIFGDVALAVNPDDERYAQYIGSKVLIPIVEREIPIISDSYVDKSFGTGVLKVTPAHDFADFEIGERNNLEAISVIDTNGILNEKCGKYNGLDRFEARKKIIDDLTENDLVIKREKINNNVGICSRCETVIEPLISDQWFVKMKDLAKPAIDAVKNGKISFYPERFSKTYMHWMENIKDWCISRQLWWGHQIPVYYCPDCKNMGCFREKISKCEKCNSKNIGFDENSLDTWFSAALWPFAILGWPDKTKQLDRFFPTDVLVTGYDIIFFWVARMIFSSLKLTKEIPFKKVLIHGLVRDSKGRKMSKSLGNGIDPLEVISEYGADSLRLTLVMGLTLGNDTRFLESKLEGNRNFVNKIWNASRFLHMNLGEKKLDDKVESLSIFDSWILSRINEVSKEVRENLERFEFGVALQKIYSLFWDEFCDWYLEFCKIDFKNNSSAVSNSCNFFLRIVKMLHPFIPFVTEKIWSIFKNSPLISSSYIDYDEKLENKSAEYEIKKIISVIHSIRNKRNEMGTPASKLINIFVESEDHGLFERHLDKIKTLSKVEGIKFGKPESKKATCIILDFAKIYVDMEELADIEKLKDQLAKDIETVKSNIKKSESMLQNKEFTQKAPKDVISSVEETLSKSKSKLKDLISNLDKLNL